MTEYRACFVGPEGRVVESRSFVCDTDENAIVWAEQLADERPIELWSGERRVKIVAPVRKHNATTHEIHGGRMIPKAQD